MNKETKKQLLDGITSIFGMFAIMAVGSVFSMAAFGILALNMMWDLSFFSLMIYWTFLFYVFSIVMFPLWEELNKRFKK